MKSDLSLQYLPVEDLRFQRRRRSRIRDILCGVILSWILTSIWSSQWSVDLRRRIYAKTVQSRVAPTPAEQWKDDMWPIFPLTPWDISTDFPYTRKLEYEVTEGTLLRLDVHPVSGEIVFDMLGELR